MRKKPSLSGRSADGSWTVNPNEFTSGLARRRAAQARFRRPRNTVDIKSEHFKCICPWCQSANVIMSPINPAVPSVLPPDVGDIVKCDICRKFHSVTQINPNNIAEYFRGRAE